MKHEWWLKVGFLFIFTSTALAQIPPIPQRTKIEALQSRTGEVIVSGNVVIGRLRAPATASGKGTGNITVTCWIFSELASAVKVRGISIDLEDEAKHQSRAYIDEGEVGALMKGMEFMGRVDRTVTGLPNFEAAFQTRGDFRISTFNEPDGSQAVALGAGSSDPIFASYPLTIYLRFDQLAGSKS